MNKEMTVEEFELEKKRHEDLLHCEEIIKAIKEDTSLEIDKLDKVLFVEEAMELIANIRELTLDLAVLIDEYNELKGNIKK